MKKQKRIVVYLLILSMMLSISPSIQAEAKGKKANKQAQKVFDFVNDSLFDKVDNFVGKVGRGEKYYYYKKSDLTKLDKNLRKQLKAAKKIDKVVKTKLKGKNYKTIKKYWKKLYASAKVIQTQAQKGTFQDTKLVQFKKEVTKFDKAYVKLYKNKDYEFRSLVQAGYRGVDGWHGPGKAKDQVAHLYFSDADVVMPKKATSTPIKTTKPSSKPTSVTPTKSPAAPNPTKQPSSAVNPTNAPAGANQGDVKALTELICTQKERGATVSEDMSSEEYEWENGRLVEIYWGEWMDEDENIFSPNLQGDISFSAFTALVSLSCEENDLSSLDVSGCVNLEYLSCGNNQLSSLDVSGCVSLESLWCGNVQLSSLNVSGCINLDVLSCGNNQLNSLDVSGCINLEKLYCDNNRLSSLDVSRNIALRWLSCDGNRLKNLDVSKNVNLEVLDCSSNRLSDLNVSQNVDLEYLDCEHNLLSTLDISKNINLEELYCDDDVTIIRSGATPTAPPAEEPTDVPMIPGNKTYHAYLGFQTNTYAFRDTWNHDTYGLDSIYLDYDSEIGYWRNNYLRRKDVNITNAEISSDGTYKVSISDIDLQTLDTNTATEYFNTLYISTDIPTTKKGVQFTDANLLIDNQTVARYDVIPQKGDAKDYYQLMLADIYAPDDGTKSCQYDSTNELDILPTDSITITFTVSGITEKTSTETPNEKPTTGPTDTTVANNYQKLANYLIMNGTYKSDNEYYYISDIYMADNATFYTSIEYNLNDSFEFSAMYMGDETTEIVTLTITPPNYEKGAVANIFVSSSNDLVYANGEVMLASLTKTNQKITYTSTNASTSSIRDDLYELGEAVLALGLQNWNSMIKDTNTGLSLKDLGFSSYEA